MEESGDDQISRKIVILDDFDHNPDISDSTNGRPTVRGQHVVFSGDKLVLTGWTPAKPEQMDTSDGGVSQFVNKGTRYYLPQDRINSWESGVTDGKTGARSNVSGVSKNPKLPNLKNVYVSHNSIWTVDPDEPIMEETLKQYDSTRRLFWMIFFPTAIVAALLLTCSYSWAFAFPGGQVANVTMNFLKLPKMENREQLRSGYNMHALIMTTAVFVNLGGSTVLYRLFPHSPIFRVKCVHAFLGFVGALGSGVGLYFSYDARKFKNETPFGVHATLGFLTIGMVQIQFLFGFSFFLLPCASFRTRVKLIPVHKVFGGFTFIISVTTMITGIVVMARFLIPIDQHVKFPPRSIVLNVVGISSALFALLATILITDHRFRRRSRPLVNITKEENMTELVNSSMDGDRQGEGDEDFETGSYGSADSRMIITDTFRKNKKY